MKKEERELIKRYTSIPENVVNFSRFLRSKSFKVGPTEEYDALTVLKDTHSFDQEEFKDLFHAVFVKNKKQHKAFESLFLEYWRNLDKASDSKVKDSEIEKRKSKSTAPSLEVIKDWLYGNSSKEQIEIATFSNLDLLVKKDFSAYQKDELDRMSEIFARLKRKRSRKKRRRFTSVKRSQLLDVKKSIRSNLRYGSEVIDLDFKQRQKDKNKLILVCDVSKSMDIYSNFLIQFLFAFQNSIRSMETFVFSSRLARITHLLKDMEYEEALSQVSDSVHHWSSGTRIGTSLDSLLQGYKSWVNGNTTVLILSDGWDSGDLDLLDRSLKLMKRKAGKILWLNPLAGNKDFKPETGGMTTALPYLDKLYPCHNLQSLEALTRDLR